MIEMALEVLREDGFTDYVDIELPAVPRVGETVWYRLDGSRVVRNAVVHGVMWDTTDVTPLITLKAQ